VDSISLSPVALLFLLAASLIILCSTRQNAVKALLATAMFMPLGQQVVLFGLHLYFSRILIMVGLIRLVTRPERRVFQWTAVDKCFLLWCLTEFIMGNIRNGISDGLIGALGFAYNALGIYFFIRLLTRDSKEAVEHVQFLALATLILALLMVPELKTQRNFFSVFGGVNPISEYRDGRVRCQGPFRISILAGTFAATLFPLMVGLWFNRGQSRRWAIIGVLGCLFVTYASGSSGPILCFLASLVGLGLWRIRDRMYLFRRGAVLLLIALSMVMKAPVWYLISKVSDLFGGSGWHRSYLIDQAVHHFNEWWLIGTSVTAHWAPAGLVMPSNPKMMDITNEFIAQGINGGALGLGLFIAIIVCCFKIIGRAVRSNEEPPLERKLIWTFGVCLAAHCSAFVSVAYFDQIEVFWLWLLAVIPCFAVLPAQDPAGKPLTESMEDMKQVETEEVAVAS
jgi:hypothetical protein